MAGARAQPDREAVLERLWRYRKLFAILAWRDITVRYKQTFIGVAWALIRPFLTMVVFTVIFGRLANLPTEGDAPYAVLVFAAMLPWQFFSTALSSCSDSLIANSNLLTKVYFPRLIVPASAVITSFVDFLISFVILAGLMLWFQWWPSWRLLTLPLWVAVAFAASMGAGLLAVDGHRAPADDHGRAPVPAHGEAVCGCDLSVLRW